MSELVERAAGRVRPFGAVPLTALALLAVPYGCGTTAPQTTGGMFVNGTRLRLYPELLPIDLATFPALTTATRGTGRLRSVVLTSVDDAEGRALAEKRPGELFDTLRGAFCTPVTFVDGVERCVDDTAATVDQTFADAACVREIAMASGRCTAPPYALSAEAPARAFLVGARLATGTYFRKTTSGCDPRPTASNDTFWLLGDAVDLDAAFPPVRRTTR